MLLNAAGEKVGGGGAGGDFFEEYTEDCEGVLDMGGACGRGDWGMGCGILLAAGGGGGSGGRWATNAKGATCMVGMYILGLTIVCDVDATGCG